MIEHDLDQCEVWMCELCLLQMDAAAQERELHRQDAIELSHRTGVKA